jgi:hypothetical protein
VLFRSYTGFNGLHRTTDGGATWTKICSESVIGYPVAFSNGKIYWPVNGSGLVMSTNNGATWTKTCSSGNRSSCGGWQGALAEMPGNKIVTISSAMNRVITSVDDGKTWATLATIPFTFPNANAAGITYCKSRNCVYVWAEPNAYRYDIGDVSVAGTMHPGKIPARQSTRKVVGAMVPAKIAGAGLTADVYDIRGRMVARINDKAASDRLGQNSYIVKLR